jgi:gas vesicle protein
MKKRKYNNSFALLFGLAAGTALGYLVNSNKGRAWRKDTYEKANKLNKNVNELASEQLENAKSNVGSVIEKSKEYVNQISDKAKEVVSDYTNRKDKIIVENVEEIESAYEKGANNVKT